jgi:hypothetical protein
MVTRAERMAEGFASRHNAAATSNRIMRQRHRTGRSRKVRAMERRRAGGTSKIEGCVRTTPMRVCGGPRTSPAIWLTCRVADCTLKPRKCRTEPVRGITCSDGGVPCSHEKGSLFRAVGNLRARHRNCCANSLQEAPKWPEISQLP